MNIWQLFMLLRWSLWLHFTHRQHQSYLLCDKQGFLITNPFMKVMADIKEWLPGPLLLLYSIVGVELPLISVPPTWSDCLKHREREAEPPPWWPQFCFWHHWPGLGNQSLGLRRRTQAPAEASKAFRIQLIGVLVEFHRSSEVLLWKHIDPEQWSWAWLLEKWKCKHWADWRVKVSRSKHIDHYGDEMEESPVSWKMLCNRPVACAFGWF